MHLFWDQHLELTSNTVFALPNQAMSLVLMNIALTMLAGDLLVHELKTSALSISGACFRENPSRLRCCRLPGIESTGLRAEK